MVTNKTVFPTISTKFEIKISVFVLFSGFILYSFVHTRCTYSEGIAIRQRDEKRIRSYELIENNYLPSNEVESVSAIDDFVVS